MPFSSELLEMLLHLSIPNADELNCSYQLLLDVWLRVILFQVLRQALNFGSKTKDLLQILKCNWRAKSKNF
jgi:hypothetical protein